MSEKREHITLRFWNNKEKTANLQISVNIQGKQLFQSCACIDYFQFAKALYFEKLIPESDRQWFVKWAGEICRLDIEAKNKRVEND